MVQPMKTYFDVLKRAYYDDVFWRKLIARPVHALEEYGFLLSVNDSEKLFSALKDFSLVLAFDKYRDLKPRNFKDGDTIPEFDNSGWGCADPKVPWGQT